MAIDRHQFSNSSTFIVAGFDCVLAPTKTKLLDTASRLAGKVENVDPVLCQASGEQFFNTSPLDLHRLLDDPGTIADNSP